MPKYMTGYELREISKKNPKLKRLEPNETESGLVFITNLSSVAHQARLLTPTGVDLYIMEPGFGREYFFPAVPSNDPFAPGVIRIVYPADLKFSETEKHHFVDLSKTRSTDLVFSRNVLERLLTKQSGSFFREQETCPPMRDFFNRYV